MAKKPKAFRLLTRITWINPQGPGCGRTHIWCILWAMLLLTPHYINGQIELDSMMAQREIATGDSLYSKRNFDSALYHYQSGAVLFERTGNRKKHMLSLLKAGDARRRLRQYSQAIEVYEKSLAYYMAAEPIDYLKVFQIKQNITKCYYWQLEFDRALEQYLQSIELWREAKDLPTIRLGHLYWNIGNIHSIKGAHDLAIAYFDSAAYTYALPEVENLGGQALTFNGIGLVHQERGSYNTSREYFQKAASIWSALEGQEIYRAYAHHNIGTSFSAVLRHDDAIEHLQLALELISTTYSPNHRSTGQIYDALAISYLAKKDFKEAIRNIDKALEVQRIAYGENHPHMAYSYTSLSKVYKALGFEAKANTAVGKAVAIQRKVYGSVNHEIAQTLNWMAELLLDQDQPEAALKHAQEALIANTVVFDYSRIDTNPEFDDALNQRHLLSSLALKSRALLNVFYKKQNPTNLDLAYQTLLLSDSLIDELRHANLKHSDKLELGKTIGAIYEQGIKACMALYHHSGHVDYKHKAFYFAEKSKSGVLREAISNHAAKSFGLLPENILAFERDLKTDISFYQSQIRDKKSQKEGFDTLQVTRWENQMFRLNRKHDSLTLSLERDYPKYFELKYSNAISSVAHVQGRLEEGQALLEYFVGDTVFYTFSLTKKDYEVKAFSMDEKAREQVSNFRKSLEDRSAMGQDRFDAFAEQAFLLHETYLQPTLDDLGEEINELIIVPDGHLSYVPFDILITRSDTGSTYKTLPYLLKTHTIGYAHSATLRFGRPGVHVDSNQKMIAFAPEYKNASEGAQRGEAFGAFRDQITELKWNRSELERINQHIAGSLFQGPQAVESTFKKNVKDYAVVHLAMHALVDDQNPMNSRLIFTTDKDSTEDGLLHAYELYNMEIPAQMVVLSACQTGLGQLSKGEGVMSLGRAFSYAGCPSILMSHWSVNDLATSILMDNFYRNLSKGQSKPLALRNAKLEFLEASYPPQTHPLFWGSFVVMGDPAPLKLKDDKTWWYWMTLVLLAVLGIVTLVIRSKEKSHSTS